ncbi:hypothetical protein [Hoylesella timonensis]|nr:hypothetical protein [Hoylesella timonensis]
MCTAEWYCKAMYGSPRIVYHYEKPMLAVVKTAMIRIDESQS